MRPVSVEELRIKLLVDWKSDNIVNEIVAISHRSIVFKQPIDSTIFQNLIRVKLFLFFGAKSKEYMLSEFAPHGDDILDEFSLLFNKVETDCGDSLEEGIDLCKKMSKIAGKRQ